MLRTLLTPVVLVLGLSGQAGAACVGTNLFDALPESRRTALQNTAQATPWGAGLLFQATRDGQEITLVGTYHLPDPRHDILVQDIAPRLDTASALLVEMGPQEEETFIRARDSNPEMMFNLTGPTLPERLSADEWTRLAAAAESRGVPVPVAAKLKPAYLSIMLAIPPCAQPDINAGQGGLDKALIDRAAKRDIPIIAVEPWNTLFTSFDKLSPEDDAALLRGALIDMNDNPDAAATIADLYFARQPRLIWELSEQWAHDGGMSQDDITRQMNLTENLLMDARNHAWVPVIEQAAEKGPIVVAVGALHLSGDQGVLALLQESGWTIRRLDE